MKGFWFSNRGTSLTWNESGYRCLRICSTQGSLCLGRSLDIQICLVFIDLRGCHGHHDDVHVQNYLEVKGIRKDGQVITAGRQVHR